MAEIRIMVSLISGWSKWFISYYHWTCTFLIYTYPYVEQCVPKGVASTLGGTCLLCLFRWKDHKSIAGTASASCCLATRPTSCSISHAVVTFCALTSICWRSMKDPPSTLARSVNLLIFIMREEHVDDFLRLTCWHLVVLCQGACVLRFRSLPSWINPFYPCRCDRNLLVIVPPPLLGLQIWMKGISPFLFA